MCIQMACLQDIEDFKGLKDIFHLLFSMLYIHYVWGKLESGTWPQDNLFFL